MFPWLFVGKWLVWRAFMFILAIAFRVIGHKTEEPSIYMYNLVRVHGIE